MKKNNCLCCLRLLSILFSMAVISVLLLNHTSADSKTVNASVNVPEACTMTSHNDTPHTATLSPNTYSGASGSEYQNGIGKTTLTATCNDDNGFSIYAIGYTGNSYDSENHNKLVGQSTNVAINTAVYTSGDTTSSWSMKVNKINDSTVSYNPQNMSILDSFDSWHIVPATYAKVAEYKASTGSSTTDTTLGAKLETTYAAYIASNQPADTYIGQVKYTMVHPYDNTPKDGPMTNCPTGNICYSPGANDIEGTMGNQATDDSGNAISDNTTVTLLASNYSRAGYGFAGWSDAYDYKINQNAHFYGPHETITVPEGTATNGLPLYAVWIASQGSLQNSDKVSQLCGTNTGSLVAAPTDGTANLSSVSALTDQRDNETYAIAKLADGKCWMIENLRLESTNRDNSTGTLAQGYGTSTNYGNFIGLADAEYTGFVDSALANSVYYSITQPGTASMSIGKTDYPGSRTPRYNNFNTQSRAQNYPNRNVFYSYDIPPANGMYSYSNYYTWHAAIADTSYYNSGNHDVTSLCPTGWKIPQGNTPQTGFGKLDLHLGGTGEGAQYSDTLSNKWRRYPNNFLCSGYIDTQYIYQRGSSGRYWTSTAYNYDRSYILDISMFSVNPGVQYTTKSSGSSIRCTASTDT